MVLGAKAQALFGGRFALSFADIREVAYPVYEPNTPHFRAEAEGKTSENIIAEALRAIPEDTTRR